MTKRLLSIAALMAAACTEDVDPNPNPPRTTPPAETQKLSASFATTCQSCHGETGLGRGEYPPIPGQKDESAFIAIVRAGRGDMPSFAESRISDDDLKADYLWLTTKRQ